MQELKQIVAKNIAELRQASGFTQLELGNAISYSDKAVSKWERAEAIPDAYVLLKLAELFGVTVDYILHQHSEPARIKVKKKTNRAVVSAISIISIWMLFAIAYICASLGGYNYPVLFMYAAVVTLIVGVVFNSMWGKRSVNMILISALVCSIILTVYLIFLFAGYNFWQMLPLCLPAIGIVVCCFKLKVGGQLLFERKNKKE